MSVHEPLRAAQDKLSAARAKLILERPFLGALVLHLPLVANPRCRSIASDAQMLHFNPDYVARLSFQDVQFLLAHEALHCALGHFHRRGHRLQHAWDLACDYAVNGLLIADGMKPPAFALQRAQWIGLAAEEIYPMLGDAHHETLDEHWFAGGEGGAMRGSESLADAQFLEAHRDGFDEIETRVPAVAESGALEAQWRQRAAACALEAARAGRLGAHWSAALDGLVQPRLPWRALLQRFMTEAARCDYSFARRSRREGGAMLPGLQSGEADVVVAVDTSGSIPAQELGAFLREIDGLKGQVRARLTVLACDAELAEGGPWYFEPWEALALPPDLAAGGGTRFTPVFEWVERRGSRPDALLYFTDAQGEFPALPPDYPVLWLVLGNAPVPFGERVQFNPN